MSTVVCDFIFHLCTLICVWHRKCKARHFVPEDTYILFTVYTADSVYTAVKMNETLTENVSKQTLMISNPFRECK